VLEADVSVAECREKRRDRALRFVIRLRVANRLFGFPAQVRQIHAAIANRRIEVRVVRRHLRDHLMKIVEPRIGRERIDRCEEKRQPDQVHSDTNRVSLIEVVAAEA
jgi:hypothetical protein